LFEPGFEVVVYGASGFGKDLKSIFQGQVDRDYFPVQFEDMRAAIEFVTLTPEPVRVGGLTVTWEYTQHPQATVGYKVEADGRAFGYASDNEYLIGHHGHPREIAIESEWMQPHRRLTEFLKGVDLLVHEAQYTNAEYATKVRWGHSSVANACVLAKFSGAKRWVVTHHDPEHEDAFLDDKLNVTRQVLRELDHPVEVANGFDGLVEYF
jgi:phosphoribosyl 1,2-cyclic phosphodiesterase